MRLITRDELMALPAGTIYAEANPCYFDTWLVKGDTIVHDGKNGDWFYEECVGGGFDVDWDGLLDGRLVPLIFNFYGGRDGGFAYDQMYAVLDEADVRAWIAALERALAMAGGAQ